VILDPGTRLGPYEVRELAGSGGMGEVYRGLDTRLNRTVAIKILPRRVATSPIRRARFEREARAVSRLSHPHICAVYDVGESDGIPFLVMEYIDGNSLEQRLRVGRLRLAEALDLSIQIAAALCAAHERGIVHRDLKPGNVMLADSGVKLLDFGIAKLLDEDEEAPPGPDGATSTILTAEQRIIGTPNYMAPEQLEGREIDQRADLFAFGALLHEMLTGRKAFAGSNPASITSAVLTADPPKLSSVLPDAAIPAALDHIIRRALAKKPEERWQTARDVMLELRSIKDDSAREVEPTGTPPRWRRRLALAAAGLAVAAVAAIVGAMAADSRSPESPHAEPAPIVLTIHAPDGTRFDAGYGSLAVSPDGLKIAFVASVAGTRSIWVRHLNAAIPRRLLGTETGTTPFWSPDSRFVGFYDGAGRISRVDLNGGKPEALADAAGSMSAASWTADNWIVFNRDGELMRVPAFGGGTAARFTAPDQGRNERFYWFPSALPDRRVLFLVRAPQLNTSSRIQGASGGETVDLPTVLSNAVFAAGHLVFRQGPALVAQRFDVRTARFSGQPVTLAYDVRYNPASGRTAFAASDTLIAYRSDAPRRLTWMDRGGRRLGSVGDEGRDWNPVMAVDGSNRVAFDRFDPTTGGFQVWTMDDQGRAAAFTHGVKERFGIWSPDGQWIAYSSPASESNELRRRRTAGPDRDELITLAEAGSITAPLEWTRDGRFFVYSAGRDLWMMPLGESQSPPVQLTKSAAIEKVARVSPDGKWLAYSSVEQDRRAIWVQAFPAAQPERRFVADGIDPSWRQDGKELYYMSLDGTLMASPVTSDQPLKFGAAVPLFRAGIGDPNVPLHTYAAAPDGQRFLVSEVVQEESPITVVIHWPALVRQ
jgi:serine/threonine protein kinase/Tol biopolymer transport system component